MKILIKFNNHVTNSYQNLQILYLFIFNNK